MDQLSGNNARIAQMMKENDYLNAAAQDSEITVTMYYYNFIIRVVIVLFLIVLLIKFSLSINGQKGGGLTDRNYNGYLFLLSIMVLVLLIPSFIMN
jgi:hypothetical protein